jgi:hypothetical protein
MNEDHIARRFIMYFRPEPEPELGSDLVTWIPLPLDLTRVLHGKRI